MIDDLLAELKELDPDLYWQCKFAGLSNAGVDSDIEPRDLIDEARLAWIQACVQKAIAERIDRNAEKARETWSYEIVADRNGYRAVTGPRDIRSIMAYGDSPAEALLSAYLEAIKHESPLPANHRAIEDRNEWNASHYLPGDEPKCRFDDNGIWRYE